MVATLSPVTALRSVARAGIVESGGNVELRDLSSRSTSYGIWCDGELTAVVKHGIDAASRQEAEIYEHLARRPEMNGVAPHHRAIGDGLLVVEAPPGARDLERHRLRHRLGTQSAVKLGRSLAVVHDADPFAPVRLPDAQRPWILGFGRYTLAEWWQLSNAGRQLAQGITELTDAATGLAALKDSWTPTHFIHGDVKFANVVRHRAEARSGPLSRLCLIDWELGGLGDPAWDLGCVVGQQLTLWVASMSVSGDVALTDTVAEAGFDLDDADRWLAIWWTSYQTRRSLQNAAASTLADRMCAYVGARVVQSGFEFGLRSHLANSRIMTLTQLGANILADPSGVIGSVLPRFGALIAHA